MDDPCPLNGSGGLTKSWKKKTYVNPPYGRPILQWTKKAYEESLKGKLVVMLLPVRSDTIWWNKYALKASEIWFIKGRIKFKGATNSAPFPSVILLFRKKEFPEYIKFRSLTVKNKIVRLSSATTAIVESELLYAWAGGIIDGEGCIHIRKNKPPAKSTHATTQYNLVIKVTMAEGKTINRLHNIFSVGHISAYKKNKYNHAPAISWFVTSLEAERVLRRVMPHIFTKRKEAKLALEFMKIHGQKRGKVRTPATIIKKKDQFYRKMRELKKHKQ